MEIGTLFELCRWGFSISIIVLGISILFAGLKDMNEIDDIMKDRKSK